jgi:hypothetical protein
MRLRVTNPSSDVLLTSMSAIAVDSTAAIPLNIVHSCVNRQRETDYREKSGRPPSLTVVRRADGRS